MTAIAFSSIISVGLLPLTPRTLNATEYGIYAMLMSIVTLVGNAMDGGASLLLPAFYGPASPPDRRRLFGTIAAVAAAGASIAALLVVSAVACNLVAPFGQVMPLSSVVAAAAIMPLRAITGIAVIAFSTTGRSGAIALQMVAQSSFVFAATLIALFWFSVGGLSLFIGAACGQSAALFICIIVLAYHGELSFIPSHEWLIRVLGNAPTSASAGFTDGARSLAENTFVVNFEGLYNAGILGHARLYYNLLMALVSSITHSVQFNSLEEGRNPTSPMSRTRGAWAPAHNALGCTGIIFALFGRDIVDLISNGNFDEAAHYIPFLVIASLIHTSEQAAAAIVFANRLGPAAVRFRLCLICFLLVALFPATAFFGIWGPIVIGIIEAATYRAWLRRLARRIRHVPFQDELSYFGIATILATMAWAHLAAPSLQARLICMVFGLLANAWAGRRWIRNAIITLHHITSRPKPLNRMRSSGSDAHLGELFEGKHSHPSMMDEAIPARP